MLQNISKQTTPCETVARFKGEKLNATVVKITV